VGNRAEATQLGGMPIRTDISEDPKGDPSKILPHQPEPGVTDDEVEPLLPRGDRPGARPPAAPGKEARTPGDRRALERQGEDGGKKA
jgi:hypothetical protein